MPKKLSELTDAEFMLYQSMIISKMREEILYIFSQFGKIPEAVAADIIENHHYYNIDEWKLMKEVLTRHYPNMLGGSRDDTQKKVTAEISKWEA